MPEEVNLEGAVASGRKKLPPVRAMRQPPLRFFAFSARRRNTAGSIRHCT